VLLEDLMTTAFLSSELIQRRRGRIAVTARQDETADSSEQTGKAQSVFVFHN
jgi:hypothetical protein